MVELAAVLAGPSVGMFFAEHGARVIKIENARTGGDMTRAWKNPNEDSASPVSAYYSSVNWNKEVHLLDLTQAADREKVYDFIRGADVVISNYKPGSGEKLKMDYKSIKQIKDNIIYGDISGFSSTNHRAAFDVVLQAESGFMHMNGTPDSGPVKMPVAMIDILAAHQMKQGLLCALLNRERTGKGAFVSATLYDTALASLANQASNYLMADFVPQRMGSLHPNIAPYGDTFSTADNLQLVLAVGTDKQFCALCELLNISHLANDPRFAHNVNRVKNRAELWQLLADVIVKYNRAELMEQLIEAEVPAGAIRDMEAVFELPEARKLILESEIEGQQTKRVRTSVFQLEVAE